MKPVAASAPEPESASSTPLGVQILSFLCGIVVAVMGCKSSLQDVHVIGKLTGLGHFTATPGKFLKVQVRNDSAGSDKEWYPDVLYEYFVDGKSIWGWRLSYEEEPKPKADWEKRLAGYAQGQNVTVYYNPAEPKDAVIEKKHDGLIRSVMKLLLGLLFVSAGVLLAVLPAWTWIKSGIGK